MKTIEGVYGSERRLHSKYVRIKVQLDRMTSQLNLLTTTKLTDTNRTWITNRINFYTMQVQAKQRYLIKLNKMLIKSQKENR